MFPRHLRRRFKQEEKRNNQWKRDQLNKLFFEKHKMPWLKPKEWKKKGMHIQPFTTICNTVDFWQARRIYMGRWLRRFAAEKKSINKNGSNARTCMTGTIRNGWKTSRKENEPATSRLPYYFHGISTKIAAEMRGREISNACACIIGSHKILGSPYPAARRTLLCSVLTLP